ncbi:uncharacterized protein K444DRAFT_240676 [Hyaloscypha bicolor E]|uniref:Uncharacterized protein n=1 Tax=Hyaloscypha bicolor E TaxID=1095630 RepID=A0A2J6SLY1_9HELO|nr:uncharacterized protein K444DRAFT_240676 [Hyaloscypha bicolor E]PMD51767.1 hypothetical protein K444DRAFT_240676 [Hyaloscypha bicolor E]
MPALPVPVNPSARPTCPVCCDILEDQSSIWTCLRVLGRPYLPIAGDEAPSLALCRREIRAPCLSRPAPQPSSLQAQLRKGESSQSRSSSSSGEPCPDSSHQPIVHPPSLPPASTAPPCWIEIGRVFQLHQPAHLAVRAGGSSMRFVFPGLGAGAFAR